MRTEKELIVLDGEDNLAISAEEGKILASLVRDSKTILEVGTGHGYSTSWLRIGRPVDGIVYTIDEVDRGVMRDDNFCKFYQATLKEFLEIKTPLFDFVFLDSEHTIDKIVKDIELLEPRITEDAVIVVHDTSYCEEMGKVLKDYFNGVDSEALNKCGVKASTSKWSYEEIKTKYGLGIAKRGEKHG